MSVNKPVVLAIDDDRDILYMLQAIGKTMGWTVYTESDSTAAADKVRRLKPDLILVDYHMPKQDGLTIVKAIRRIDKLVPLIVLTVDERQEIADRFLDAGANDFANKPIKVADLAARIKVHMQLLQSQRELAAGSYSDKGINEATLQLVRDYCRKVGRPFLIEEVTENVGLAYQTTVRYLQYLLSRKELTAASDYGKVGRPRKKFCYVKTGES